ncbi:LacI family DNA-binding transcriptional regulator [Agaribacter flavus]|uniref:LacI family DNA-binding transcriptional regulator n=1 Tax=Agaribacter flavus TaxID=1902781 RepID=A0ABV7FKC3_9ALTE
MVRLSDVAEKAGVSAATVSRVVRGEGKVGDKCRAHVKQVIAEMGYRPNINARALASKKNEIIGVITPNVTQAFYGALVTGAENAAQQVNYRVMLNNSHNQIDTELDAISSFRENGSQNIVYHSNVASNEQLINLAKEIQGLVVLNRYIPEIAHRCVWLDNTAGGRLSVKHLIDKGHRKFVFLASNQDLQDPVDRLKGAKGALLEAGIPWLEENVGYIMPSIDNGMKGISQLLERKCEFTAVVAFNDSLAIGAMNRLQDLGVKIPEDVSVIGFDNTDICKACRPQLTTTHYPIAEMAKYATELSLKLTTTDEIDSTKTHLYLPHVYERDSVATRSAC